MEHMACVLYHLFGIRLMRINMNDSGFNKLRISLHFMGKHPDDGDQYAEPHRTISENIDWRLWVVLLGV